MTLADFARRILPSVAYESIVRRKKELDRSRLARLPPLTETGLAEILVNSLGLVKDDLVFVHASLNHLNLNFPFYRILTVLREVIGPQGTVLFPTYPNNRISSYEYLLKGEVFDVRRTPSYTGILTEFARRQRNAVRSLHPTRSVSAIGAAAKEITATHHLSPYPYDTCSPYYKLIEGGGKIVGLGVSTNYISFGHCVDDALKERFPVRVYHEQMFDALCINHDGESVTVRTYAHDMSRFVHIDMPRFMRTHVSTEACQDLTIRGMKFFRASAPELFSEMMALAEQGITIYPRSVYRKSSRQKAVGRRQNS